MKKVSLVCNKDFVRGTIDPRMFGALAEHMGRVVYTGIYDPGNVQADENGFRRDLLQAVLDAGITTVRYPGGNFVSTYQWEDGVGPVEKRPVRLDLAWKTLEPNTFGTDEFMRWSRLAKVQPLVAVNLGTRGIVDAVNYLEYCNIKGGTKYSNMRIENGTVDPYNIKMWCLGNEMDGDWQIGHKTAHEYGRLAAETSKAMKAVDPTIETVLCGSSLNTMETYPSWEAQVLADAYEYVDYISLHQYFAGQEKGTEAFLSQADEMNDYIGAVMAASRYTQALKKSTKSVKISFDEWGVWTRASSETNRETEEKRWESAPAISEMIYSFEDALLYAGMLMALLKNCDNVKIACQSLIANISSMIMTTKDGIWLQPTYYPFQDMARYAGCTVLDSRSNAKDGMLDTVSVYDQGAQEVAILAVNRSVNEDAELQVNLQGLRPIEVVEHRIMQSADLKARNDVQHDLVKPTTCDGTTLQGDLVLSQIPALSWNVIRVKVG